MTKHYHVVDSRIGHCLVVVPDDKELPAEYADSAKLMDVPDDWSKSSWDSVAVLDTSHGMYVVEDDDGTAPFLHLEHPQGATE